MTETTTTEATKTIPVWSTVQSGVWNTETQKLEVAQGVDPVLVAEGVIKQNIALSQEIEALKTQLSEVVAELEKWKGTVVVGGTEEDGA